VNAEAPFATETKPRWRRRLAVAFGRRRFIALVEAGTVVALIVMAVISYLVITKQSSPDKPMSPALVALLLVANLVPAMALMVLIARRQAIRRALQSPIGGKGRLHVRLVAVFSGVAAVPTVLVAITASLLFQYGVEFWYSARTRGMIENAVGLGQQIYTDELKRVGLENLTMATNIKEVIDEVKAKDSQIPTFIETPEFQEFFAYQVYYRNLSEAVIVRPTSQGLQSLILANPYARDLNTVVTPQMIAELRHGRQNVVVPANDRVGSVTRLPVGGDLYLYVARVHDPEMVARVKRAKAIASDYQALITRSRALQLRFNAALLALSLLIVAISIWIALKLADRLVRPVGELVDAARKITAGDLSARVRPTREKDELGTLGHAFNRMTGRLEEQTGALVSANAQLESRRAFIEAVLSGVTAGIISLDQQRNVRLINSSAEALLKTDKDHAVGRKLAELAPELDAHLDGDEREDIIQFASGGEPRTLAVKRVRVEGGHVLTFDDITEQLLDQRRAAWSDVARRIAHEIRNPLTPIQLAAERLQRRYGKEITSDAGTFEQLTGTIVRQVGDLRRMVDEFSSFARMPKPVFREEKVADIVRESLFLHQVAHPGIRFTLDAPEPSPLLVCDRRQLGQALTNVIKNGVEAIQQKREDGVKEGEDGVAVTLRASDSRISIEVADTGIGLPGDRGRLTEPYMTTRAKGTGLGLAIVKKIVEEHFGSLEFDDSAGGGTLVRLVFDAESLARLAGAAAEQPQNTEANG
jgi:two-component system, NtrC family, nitrogen regulation sensor histidine kinase NtrY